MGIVLNKRINLGKGIGLNLSKSGVSSSLRTKYGSFGTSGFSIRSGIPGLYFRKYNSKKNGDFMIFFLLIVALTIGFAVVYFLFKFLTWAFKEFYKLIRRRMLERQIRKSIATKVNANQYLGLNEKLISSVHSLGVTFLKKRYQQEYSNVDLTQPICQIGNENYLFDIYGTTNGTIEYHVDLGSPIIYNDIICSIKVN